MNNMVKKGKEARDIRSEATRKLIFPEGDPIIPAEETTRMMPHKVRARQHKHQLVPVRS